MGIVNQFNHIFGRCGSNAEPFSSVWAGDKVGNTPDSIPLLAFLQEDRTQVANQCILPFVNSTCIKNPMMVGYILHHCWSVVIPAKTMRYKQFQDGHWGLERKFQRQYEALLWCPWANGYGAERQQWHTQGGQHLSAIWSPSGPLCPSPVGLCSLTALRNAAWLKALMRSSRCNHKLVVIGPKPDLARWNSMQMFGFS